MKKLIGRSNSCETIPGEKGEQREIDLQKRRAKRWRLTNREEERTEGD
jgi:hypothetical protein